MRPMVEGAQQMAYGDNPPDLLGMLTSGHQNIVGKLAAANQDYTTWNRLRNMLGQPALQSMFYQGQPNMVDLTSPVLRDPRRMAQGKIR